MSMPFQVVIDHTRVLGSCVGSDEISIWTRPSSGPSDTLMKIELSHAGSSRIRPTCSPVHDKESDPNRRKGYLFHAKVWIDRFGQTWV